MRFALWQLMWATIGLTIGTPIIVLIEHFTGQGPELMNVIFGALLVFAAWGVGIVLVERWNWPRWLDGP